MKFLSFIYRWRFGGKSTTSHTHGICTKFKYDFVAACGMKNCFRKKDIGRAAAARTHNLSHSVCCLEFLSFALDFMNCSRTYTFNYAQIYTERVL